MSGVYRHTAAEGRAAIHFRTLVGALVVREFKGQYRRSLLGPAWAFIQPLAYMVIFIFLRGVLDISSEGAPYALFTFCALVPWTFFSNAITRCAPSIYANGAILKKISIAREVFPVAAVFTSLLDLAIASVILTGMMIWYAVPLSIHMLWLPVLITLTGLLALGFGLAAAAIGTFKRDVMFAIPFAMQFWLLATPVMYPASQVPERWRAFYDLNPMVGLIDAFRAVLIRAEAPDLTSLGASVALTALVWALAWPLFRSVSNYFADVL
ncbi:ABC transporter permease [Magnetofaba australis]|uniref:Transport permease protein n=1 Tax=Magnetofaba australis IT-1 TaxID=1434232 RepID=A0A1Y2JYW1_9PROT|nr:ABC transporter permease [Magnetofaba australis]OSM00075.1 putative ABC transporter [Magnetofaba australis IT-1]